MQEYPESQIRHRITEQLKESGWADGDLLVEPSLYTREQVVRPDLVLTYSLYPLAVVEAKRTLKPIEPIRQQVLSYADIAEVPFAFMTDGTNILQANTVNGEWVSVDRFPTPRDIWTQLGRDWDPRDPRLYRSPRVSPQGIGLHHAFAVSHMLDAIISGKRLALLQMATGSGITFVAAQLAAKLLGSGYCRRMLYLADGQALLQQAMQSLSSPEETRRFPQDDPQSSASRQWFALSRDTHRLAEVLTAAEQLPGYFDLIIIQNPEQGPSPALLSQFGDAVVIGLSNIVSPHLLQDYGQPVYSFSLQQALDTDISEPPEGFRPVTLDEVADVRSGLRAKVEARDDEEAGASATRQVYILRGRDIRPTGELGFESADRIAANLVSQDLLLQPNDILLLAYGSNCKVALVPTSLPGSVTFAHTLMRIRVDPQLARAEDVYEFLRSDSGQLALRRLIHGTVIPFLSIRHVRQLTVFLPLAKKHGSTTIELSATTRALRDLRQEVMPLLEEMEHAGLQGDSQGGASEFVAEKLRQLAGILVPPSLSERVLEDYPTPIALPYRRFLEARFNIYERVLRLRDVFEAASFFVYNVTLADVLRRLDRAAYHVQDKGARKAYNGYSLHDRLEFVSTILSKATANRGLDLFVPELADASDVVNIAKSLQDELRNPLSHTAAAGEGRQRRLLDKYQPIVEDMLSRLEFLTLYRLVRIPAISYHRGKWMRQLEMYKGVAPSLDESPFDGDPAALRADRDHLVLLDADEDVLDLYPLYELVANEETRDEKQLCVFKQRKAGERQLQGESVPGAFELILEGYDELETLLSKLPD